MGPTGDWVEGPNFDFFQVDHCDWTLDGIGDDESPSAAKAALKPGVFVIFENINKWVDPLLFWLVGRVEGITPKTNTVTLWVWGTASHHDSAAFVRDFSKWCWRPSWR